MPDPHESLEARRAAQAAARAERATELNDEPAHLRTAAVVACGLCDDDGYRGRRVCDHQDHAAAAQRGMAKVRAAMAKGAQR